MPAGSAIENPCGVTEGMPRSRRSQDHEQDRGSCCSKFADFIGNVQAELIPSTPQLPPKAVMQNALVEILLHGTELSRDLHDEFGPVAIFHVPGSPQHVVNCRTFVLV